MVNGQWSMVNLLNKLFKFRELMKLKKLKKLKDDTLGCGLHSAPYSAAKAIFLSPRIKSAPYC